MRLGNYFADGINQAVPTHREGVIYGYQFWVYVLDNTGKACFNNDWAWWLL